MTIESQIPWAATGDEFDDMWDESPWAQEQPEAVPDILCTMFAQQQNLMGMYSKDSSHSPHIPAEPHEWGQLDSRRIQAALREFAGYTVEELYEAIGNLKNKPWKATDVATDKDAFVEEVADVWHFFIEFHILAGLDPLDVFRAYFRKSFINVNRVQTGY